MLDAVAVQGLTDWLASDDFARMLADELHGPVASGVGVTTNVAP